MSSVRELEEDRSGSSELRDYVHNQHMSTIEQAFAIRNVKAKNQKGIGRQKSFQSKQNQRIKRKNLKHRRALQNFDTYEYLSGVNLEKDYVLSLQTSQNQLKKLDFTEDIIKEVEEPYYNTVSSEFAPPPLKESAFNLISVSSCIDKLTTFKMITEESGLQIQNAIQLIQGATEAVKNVRDDFYIAETSEISQIQNLIYQILSSGVDILGRLWQKEQKHYSWEEILDFFQSITEQIFVIQKTFEQYKIYEDWDLSKVVERLALQLFFFAMDCQEDLLSAKNLNPELMFVHSVQERAKALKLMWRRGFEIVFKLGQEWGQFKCSFKFQWALVLRKAAIQIEQMQHTVPGWDDVENSPFLRSGMQEGEDYEEEDDDDYEDDASDGDADWGGDYNDINNIDVRRRSSKTKNYLDKLHTQTPQNNSSLFLGVSEVGSGGILNSAFIKDQQPRIEQDTAWAVTPSPNPTPFDDKVMEAHAWLVDILKVLFQEAAKILSELEGEMNNSEYYEPELAAQMEDINCKNMNDFFADFRIKFSDLAITSLGCALALSANPSTLAFWALQKLEEHNKKCLALIKSYDKSELGIDRIMNPLIEHKKKNYEFRKMWRRLSQKQVKKLRNYYSGLWNALFKVQQLITVRSQKQKVEPKKGKRISALTEQNIQQQQQQKQQETDYVQQMYIPPQFKVGDVPQQVDDDLGKSPFDKFLTAERRPSGQEKIVKEVLATSPFEKFLPAERHRPMTKSDQDVGRQTFNTLMKQQSPKVFAQGNFISTVPKPWRHAEHHRPITKSDQDVGRQTFNTLMEQQSQEYFAQGNISTSPQPKRDTTPPLGPLYMLPMPLDPSPFATAVHQQVKPQDQDRPQTFKAAVTSPVTRVSGFTLPSKPTSSSQSPRTPPSPSHATTSSPFIPDSLQPSPFERQRDFSFGPRIIQPGEIINDSATDISDITVSTVQTNTTNTSNNSHQSLPRNASIPAPAFPLSRYQPQNSSNSNSMPKDLEDQIEQLVKKGGDFWKRRFSDLRIVKHLSQGAFAFVFKVRWQSSPSTAQEVALKHIILNTERGVEEEVVRQFIKEAKIYEQLGKHENVMYCHGVVMQLDRNNEADCDTGCIKDGSNRTETSEINHIIPSDGLKFGLLLEYCEVGTVMELIKRARQFYKNYEEVLLDYNRKCGTMCGKRPPRAPSPAPSPELLLYFSWRMRIDLALQIAKGLKHMHSKNVVHRDLTSYNVMLKWSKDKRKLVCKVGDFNLSKAIAEQLNGKIYVPNSIPIHSPEWLADEIINVKGAIYSKESDVFSLGIILWELITLKLPWADETRGSIHRQIMVIQLKMDSQRLELCAEKIQGVPLMPEAFEILQKLVLQCQNPDRTQRPTLDSLIQSITNVRDMFEEDDCMY